MTEKLPYEEMVEEMAREYSKVKVASYTAPAYTGKSVGGDKSLMKPFYNLYKTTFIQRENALALFRIVNKSELKEMLLLLCKDFDRALALLEEDYACMWEKTPVVKYTAEQKATYGERVRKLIMLQAESQELSRLLCEVGGFFSTRGDFLATQNRISFKILSLIAF